MIDFNIKRLISIKCAKEQHYNCNNDYLIEISKIDEYKVR